MVYICTFYSFQEALLSLFPLFFPVFETIRQTLRSTLFERHKTLKNKANDAFRTFWRLLIAAFEGRIYAQLLGNSFCMRSLCEGKVRILRGEIWFFFIVFGGCFFHKLRSVRLEKDIEAIIKYRNFK
jgi:hypothetical protein